jgi:hypothetical protein
MAWWELHSCAKGLAMDQVQPAARDGRHGTTERTFSTGGSPAYRYRRRALVSFDRHEPESTAIRNRALEASMEPLDEYGEAPAISGSVAAVRTHS